MVTTRSSTRRRDTPGKAQHRAFRLRNATRRRKKPNSAALGFKLLELPWEIRQIILRDLLWQPEPITFTSVAQRFTGPTTVRTIDDPAFEDYWINLRERGGEDARKFYPEILSVCKQLYDEGSPILYDNSVNCRITSLHDFEGNWQGYDLEMIILGERYSLPREAYEDLFMELPRPVLEKMRKARVEIFASRRWGHYSFLDVQNAVRNLAHVLRKSNWRDLNIQLKIHEEPDYQPPLEEDEDMARLKEYPPYRHELFKQFLCLRDCKVSITGASRSLTSKLTHVMTSSSDEYPVIDLDAMFADIERYVELSMSQDRLVWEDNTDEEQDMIDDIEGMLDELDGLRESVDTEEFLKCRSVLMKQISELLLLRQANVFAHDPVGTPYKPQGTTLMPDEGERVWRYEEMLRSS